MKLGPNRILAAIVGVVVVIGVVAAVVSAIRDNPTYDRGTPEGAVQAYLTAVLDGDHVAAIDLLADDSPCGIGDLDRAFVPEGVRIVLRDSEVTGNTARLGVDIVVDEGGPLGGSGFTERQRFRLSRVGDDWRLSDTPWPMFECGPVR